MKCNIGYNFINMNPWFCDPCNLWLMNPIIKPYYVAVLFLCIRHKIINLYFIVL